MVDLQIPAVWLAYIRVHLRLAYEMNRQLQADSDLSLPDYDVLTALGVTDPGRMPITMLAAQIGWERSRVSTTCVGWPGETWCSASRRPPTGG